MPEQNISDPLEAAVGNLNLAQERPVKKGFGGPTLALTGIGYALVAIADELRRINAKA
jgi:hypothetical protein